MEDRTVKQIYHELVGNPFFPLLFIGKAVETAGFAVIGSATWEEAGLMTILGIAATIMWVLSDTVDIDVNVEGNILR